MKKLRNQNRGGLGREIERRTEKIEEKKRRKKSRNKAEKKKSTLSRGGEPSISATTPHYTATMFGKRIIGVPSRRNHKPPETATTLPHSR
jgi:hypothetical protein